MNDLTLRAPSSAEISRLLHLFGPVRFPRQAKIIVAVRNRPVERFVAALAGWPEAEFLRFHAVCLPGIARREVLGLLINHSATIARAAGLKQMAYARLLMDGEEETALLRENGFEILRSERYFRLAASLAETRVLQLLQKSAKLIPPSWHTQSIRNHPPDRVFDLIAPFRLMTSEELQSFWRPGGQNGFDPDLSSILFEGNNAFGTLLARRVDDSLSYDIRVVKHSHARMRALGNLCLFEHCIKNHDLSNPVRWLLFRGGEVEHKETANLAFRMGASELPPRHVLTRPL